MDSNFRYRLSPTLSQQPLRCFVNSYRPNQVRDEPSVSRPHLWTRRQWVRSSKTTASLASKTMASLDSKTTALLASKTTASLASKTMASLASKTTTSIVMASPWSTMTIASSTLKATRTGRTRIMSTPGKVKPPVSLPIPACLLPGQQSWRRGLPLV